jgi:alkylhydroperoxidase family enzyme
MSRIPYPDLSKKSARVREICDALPINLTRMAANASEGVLEGFHAFGGAFYHNDLPQDLREIGTLRAGYVAGSDYETWQHESAARSVGLSDAAIAAIKAGKSQPGVLTPVQAAVLTFCDEYVVKHRVSDAALAEVRKHLNDQQLVDLMLVTGLYLGISCFLETTGVERDEKPIDAKSLTAGLS